MDRISALPDELLHVILDLVGDALDVTSTAVLSRRWRHVWVHAKNLTFDDDDNDLHEDGNDLNEGTAPLGQFAGFVDWVLAGRADADMDSLQINVSLRAGTSPEQASEWLRYAARRVVKSVVLHLRESGAPLVVELPAGHIRTASVEMNLSNRWLRLPPAAAAMYEALTELLLFSVSFDEEEAAPGGEEEVPSEGRAIGEFVTRCCPRLRRLRIVITSGLLHLVLRAEALEELEVSFAWDLRTLDVTAPNLRVLKVVRSFRNAGVPGVNNVARIAAPALEEITMSNYRRHRPDLDIHDLTGVRRLRGLSVDMHGKYCDRDTYVGLWLIENCPGVQHVNVMLRHGEERSVVAGVELFDLTSKGEEAPIVNVTSMVVRPIEIPDRYLVASVSSLLMLFPCLRSLSIRICDTKRVALELLEDVEITGFTGADEEMKLVTMLFESSHSIKRMALRGDAIGHLMTKIPSTDRGRWNFAEQVINWKRYEPKTATLVN